MPVNSQGFRQCDLRLLLRCVEPSFIEWDRGASKRLPVNCTAELKRTRRLISSKAVKELPS